MARYRATRRIRRCRHHVRNCAMYMHVRISLTAQALAAPKATRSCASHYLDKCDCKEPSVDARDAQLQRRMWRYSVDAVKVHAEPLMAILLTTYHLPLTANYLPLKVHAEPLMAISRGKGPAKKRKQGVSSGGTPRRSCAPRHGSGKQE